MPPRSGGRRVPGEGAGIDSLGRLRSDSTTRVRTQLGHITDTPIGAPKARSWKCRLSDSATTATLEGEYGGERNRFTSPENKRCSSRLCRSQPLSPRLPCHGAPPLGLPSCEGACHKPTAHARKQACWPLTWGRDRAICGSAGPAGRPPQGCPYPCAAGYVAAMWGSPPVGPQPRR